MMQKLRWPQCGEQMVCDGHLLRCLSGDNMANILGFWDKIHWNPQMRMPVVVLLIPLSSLASWEVIRKHLDMIPVFLAEEKTEPQAGRFLRSACDDSSGIKCEVKWNHNAQVAFSKADLPTSSLRQWPSNSFNFPFRDVQNAKNMLRSIEKLREGPGNIKNKTLKTRKSEK